MKTIKKTLLSLSLACATLAANAESPVAITQENLVGIWACEASVAMEQGKMHYISTEKYLKDGRSKSEGSMKLSFGNLNIPDLEYTITGAGTWKLDGSKLTETVTELDIKNLTDPQFDQFINLKDMIPMNVPETSLITKLTQSTIAIKAGDSEEVLECKRS
ncbi:hypothetical protein [Endozoicomonas numazuensis]|uniref:Lipocalin-like domain-containing protein n=1 Tax=Endozoicomonas numazuensis TaxID=1137799 RepID=A0A081NK17_9GAMM|nr:hypothetical protein [Endozoicomonas numazuensis]KEQ18790.1 hypothetical protein GZ78_01505 [Endozoicomonas numazuensis]